jgi:Uma2 family endonuclease
MVAASNLEEPLRMTETEYLAFEEQSEIKHEFVNGEVLPRTGLNINHNLICVSTNATLFNQVVDAAIFVLLATRVKIPSQPVYRYPDVMVIAGRIQHYNKRNDTVTNPIVLLEVVSPSTETVDRNQKLKEYTQIASLQEYVIITQDEPLVERYLRQDSGDWIYTQVTGLDGVLDLPSIGYKLALVDVYSQVTVDLTEDTE